MRLIALLFALPWWVSLAVVLGLFALGIAVGLYLRWKFGRIVRDAVRGAGAALDRAGAEVHEVLAVG